MSRNTITPYSSWPMTCEPLPTSPYSPKNSPSRSGGDSRIMNTRSATWTPPSPLPRIAPAMTNVAMPAVVPLNPSEATPSNRPTTHETRTAISVRFGPERSTSQPHPKLATIATTVSEIEAHQPLALGQADRLDRHDAHHDDERVHRVAVEEPAEQESEQARDGPRVSDRHPRPASASPADRVQVTVRHLRAARVAHDQEDRYREDREQDAGDEEDRVGRLRDAEQQQDHAGEDRAHVPDAHADPGQLSARLGIADRSTASRRSR